MENTHKSDHKKLYLLIFVLLAVLTIVEVYVPEIKALSYGAKAASLTALAIIKAFLVAYFYMHLNEERAWLKFIAAIPIVAVLYAVVLIIESVYR